MNFFSTEAERKIDWDAIDWFAMRDFLTNRKMKALNSISLNMLDDSAKGFKICQTLGTIDDCFRHDMILRKTKLESCIGHQQLVDVVNEAFDTSLTRERKTVKLEKDELVVVFQYFGDRLEEGTTELPKGAEIRALLVRII